MGAYKQFLTSDIIITPFEVNKSFTFQGASELTASAVSIDRFLGLNTSSLFNPTIDPKTGQNASLIADDVYDFIDFLYSKITNR